MLKVIFIFLVIFSIIAGIIWNSKTVMKFVLKYWKLILTALVSAVLTVGIVFI